MMTTKLTRRQLLRLAALAPIVPLAVKASEPRVVDGVSFTMGNDRYVGIHDPNFSCG